MKKILLIFLLNFSMLNAQDYSHVKDVYNQTIDLDSVIITYAGKLGIPPQLIKAQILEESSFKPAMRYEPFLDAYYQTNQRWKARIKNCQYWVDSTANGKPIAPTNHKFWYLSEWNTVYPGYVGSIYDVWKENQDEYSRKIYPAMNSIWNKKLYAPALKIVKNAHKDWTPARLASYADSVAVGNWPSYLSDKYMGGLKNIIAQTRIMSSYGFLQMIYFIAITERGYPENNTNLPEVLMITDTSFTYSTRHLIAMFSNKVINENYYSNTGWKAGFETTWYKVFGLYNGSYNSKTQKSKYADDVFKYMKNYLPQSK